MSARTPRPTLTDDAFAVITARLAPELDVATEDELLLRAAEGDEGAFAELYDRMSGQVFGVCRRVLRDAALAEEVSQEVFVEVWQKADRFDTERGSASAFVTTLAHRRAVDRVRSEQASRNREEKVSRRDTERSFDVVADAVEVRLDHERVRLAVADLSDRQREAVELAYFGGYTYRQVAEVLGIPEGTAKSRLRDALSRLRDALAEVA